MVSYLAITHKFIFSWCVGVSRHWIRFLHINVIAFEVATGLISSIITKDNLNLQALELASWCLRVNYFRPLKAYFCLKRFYKYLLKSNGIYNASLMAVIKSWVITKTSQQHTFWREEVGVSFWSDRCWSNSLFQIRKLFILKSSRQSFDKVGSPIEQSTTPEKLPGTSGFDSPSGQDVLFMWGMSPN